jgi:uncharacterized protein YuzE
MSNQKDKFEIEYNREYDILYIRLKDSYDSYVEERTKGILVNRDFETDEIVGVDIWNFSKRILNNEPLPTPINVDYFKNI